MDFLPQQFSALGAYKQFVVYKIQPSTSRLGKNDKIPIDPNTGQRLKWQDPDNLLDHSSAISAAKKIGINTGVGFVFTKHDPFFFLDIDNCLEPCGTKWSPLATQLCAAFPGAAIEVSQSGKGLHIFGIGKIENHGCRNAELNLEFYTSDRFVALTGVNAVGSIGTDYSPVLQWLNDNFFKSNQTSLTKDFWSDKPCEGWRGPEDNDVLLQRMLRSDSAGSAFGGKASFKDLWEANVEVLARNYPHPDKAYNESSADAALAQHLAFWTGNNCDRMLSIMLDSKLYREKWEREKYLTLTIRAACQKQAAKKEWYCEKQAETTITPTDQPRIISANRFVPLDEQVKLFKGCVYICDTHQVLTPGGYCWTPHQFRVMYGGRSFPLDAENGKVTRNAWEAFTESQVIDYPKAHSSTFKPTEAPGALLELEGQILVNTYAPTVTKREKGDASPMLWHLDKIFGDERDSTIILSYLAALVRYLGVKFEWCPFIQGVEGNGKSLLSLCVQAAIGKRYCRFPRASEIDNKFNIWMYQSVFVSVEDIYDGNREIIEVLKPIITGKQQAVEPKGVDAITRDICCNFLINSNHKDGLRKYRNDRRFAPFYTRQQEAEDLIRDGMDGPYFFNIFEWLERKNGYAIFANYLDEYDIPEEFNPATRCKRAPITSATEEAIEHGRSGVEQEIQEAIEQEQIGFRGGWISSIMLEHLLSRIKMSHRLPLNKRREVLKSLGYDWHPGLKDGRVNSNVLPDSGKPKLFIRVNHEARNLTTSAAIAKAYEVAQTTS